MATAVTSTDEAPRIWQPIPCAHAPAKPPAHVYDKIITVAVGPDEAKKKFKIYRGLLCHFSRYFDRMLNGSFREGSLIYLRLRDVEAETFSIFHCWLNSGLVHYGDGLAWKSLTDAYIFADYHQSPLFRNAVLDYLYLRYSAEKKITVFADLLYGNTTERDCMSKLVVDFTVAADGFRQCDKHYLLNFPKELQVDVMVACRERGRVLGDCAEIEGYAWLANLRNSFCER